MTRRRREGQAVAFELTVSAAGQKDDVSQRTVPLLPYGVPVYAAASGVATTDTTAWVEPPRNMTIERPTLSILVGPTVDQSLLDVLFGAPLPCQCEAAPIASDIETATSDLMAGLGLQKLLGSDPRRRRPASRSARRPHPLGRRPVGLVAERRRRLELDRRGRRQRTLRHVAGPLGAEPGAEGRLPRARRAVPKGRRPGAESDCRRGRQRLREQGDSAARAVDGRSRRLRPGQPAAPRAAAAFDRRRWRIWRWPWPKWTASRWPANCSTCWPTRDLDEPSRRDAAEQAALPWSQSPAELHALWALALQQAAPQSPKAKEAVDWLLAHRVGYRWSPDKATGPAALALCRWAAETRFDGERYTLKVFVNDVLAKTLDVDPKAGTQTIDVPGRAAEEGGPAADQLPDRRPRALLVPVHSRRLRAGREAQEHDRRLDGHAHLRAGAVGGRRPRNPARLRRRSGTTTSSRIR